VTRREELRKQWAEYQRELDAVLKKRPEDEARDIGGLARAVYRVNDGLLEIIEKNISIVPGAGITEKSITLSGDQAEKLYQFLGGLYGE
jgi:hypothetical protein